ncbi:MDR family MFS transporter [Acidithiobacillus sp.]|uniref:MDR family MFS transporter n=1 Tax=Acidithiobacillus sp. TaxID=1872118 RepID=UPI0025C3C358|nr:MDR family MFS transporter [Acidithiobacillus sp.]
MSAAGTDIDSSNSESETAVPHRWAITVAVMTAIVMNVLDITIVNVALPHMEGSLRANSNQITWALTTYMLAMVIVTPLTGLLVEHFGQRRLILASVAGFLLCSALSGQSHSLPEIVLWRFFQGVFGASLVPVGQAILVESYPRSQRGIAMATLGMGTMLGPILGPVLGGYLTEDLSWRWCFYVNLPIGVIALILLFFYAPDFGRSEHPSPLDWQGLLWMTLGLGGLQLILSLGDQDDWFSSRFIVATTVVAALASLLFVVHSLSVCSPVVNLRLLADRSLTLGSIGIGLFGLALYGTMVVLPIYLQNYMGYEPQTAGLVMAPQGIGSWISMWAAGRLLNRGASPRLMIIAGVFLGSLGTWLSLSYDLDISPAWIIWPGVIRGLGLGLISIPLFTLAFTTLSKADTPAGSGIFNLMRNLGGSVGIAIVSTILTEQAQVAWNQMGGHISLFAPAVHHYLHAVGLAQGPLAWQVLGMELERHAAMRGILDAFWFLLASFLVVLVIVLFMPGKEPNPEKGRLS